MDLLDRYLQAVKKYLPWQRQDDIIAELRANLESQLQDKEAELGRPLSTEEAEAWLRQIGPPIQVASRYQPQQYLIGPTIFSTYWLVLRTVFIWVLIIYTIVSTVQILIGPILIGSAILRTVLHLPGILIVSAAWVTLIFAAIEICATRYPTKFPAIAGHFLSWSPSSLPPLEQYAASRQKSRSYAQAVVEVVSGSLFLLWLLLFPKHPYLLMGPGTVYLHLSPFVLAPVWVQFYWWVVGLNMLQLGWRWVELWGGSWQQQRPAAQHITIKALGLIPLALLLTARDHIYVMLKYPAQDQTHYGSTLDTINLWIHRGFSIICAIVVLQLIWDIGQMSLDAYRRRAAATR